MGARGRHDGVLFGGGTDGCHWPCRAWLWWEQWVWRWWAHGTGRLAIAPMDDGDEEWLPGTDEQGAGAVHGRTAGSPAVLVVV